jgi:hypothetical protein
MQWVKAQNQNRLIKTNQLGKENITSGLKWRLLATANDTEKIAPRPTITSRYWDYFFIAILMHGLVMMPHESVYLKQLIDVAKQDVKNKE